MTDIRARSDGGSIGDAHREAQARGERLKALPKPKDPRAEIQELKESLKSHESGALEKFRELQAKVVELVSKQSEPLAYWAELKQQVRDGVLAYDPLFSAPTQESYERLVRELDEEFGKLDKIFATKVLQKISSVESFDGTNFKSLVSNPKLVQAAHLLATQFSTVSQLKIFASKELSNIKDQDFWEYVFEFKVFEPSFEFRKSIYDWKEGVVSFNYEKAKDTLTTEIEKHGKEGFSFERCQYIYQTICYGRSFTDDQKTEIRNMVKDLDLTGEWPYLNLQLKSGLMRIENVTKPSTCKLVGQAYCYQPEFGFHEVDHEFNLWDAKFENDGLVTNLDSDDPRYFGFAQTKAQLRSDLDRSFFESSGYQVETTAKVLSRRYPPRITSQVTCNSFGVLMGSNYDSVAVGEGISFEYEHGRDVAQDISKSYACIDEKTSSGAINKRRFLNLDQIEADFVSGKTKWVDLQKMHVFGALHKMQEFGCPQDQKERMAEFLYSILRKLKPDQVPSVFGDITADDYDKYLSQALQVSVSSDKQKITIQGSQFEIGQNGYLGSYDLRTLSDEEAARLGELTNLEIVNLNSLTSLSDAAAAGLGKLKRLESLYLPFLTSLSDTAAAELGNLENLGVLWLSSLTSLSDAAAAGLGNLENLGVLSLNSLTSLSDTAAAELGNLENLGVLSLSSLTSLSEAAAAGLGNLENLGVLRLRSLTSLSGAVAVQLGKLKNLEDLDLSSLTSLSGVAVAELGSLTKLEILNLSSLTSLSDAAAAELGKLKNLEDLDLSSLTSLSDAAAAELGKLTKLEYLHLDSLTSLSDVAAAKLGNLTKLKYLDLGSLPSLSASQARALLVCGALREVIIKDQTLSREDLQSIAGVDAETAKASSVDRDAAKGSSVEKTPGPKFLDIPETPAPPVASSSQVKSTSAPAAKPVPSVTPKGTGEVAKPEDNVTDIEPIDDDGSEDGDSTKDASDVQPAQSEESARAAKPAQSEESTRAAKPAQSEKSAGKPSASPLPVASGSPMPIDPSVEPASKESSEQSPESEQTVTICGQEVSKTVSNLELNVANLSESDVRVIASLSRLKSLRLNKLKTISISVLKLLDSLNVTVLELKSVEFENVDDNVRRFASKMDGVPFSDDFHEKLVNWEAKEKLPRMVKSVAQKFGYLKYSKFLQSYLEHISTSQSFFSKVFVRDFIKFYPKFYLSGDVKGKKTLLAALANNPELALRMMFLTIRRLEIVEYRGFQKYLKAHPNNFGGALFFIFKFGVIKGSRLLGVLDAPQLLRKRYFRACYKGNVDAYKVDLQEAKRLNGTALTQTAAQEVASLPQLDPTTYPRYFDFAGHNDLHSKGLNPMLKQLMIDVANSLGVSVKHSPHGGVRTVEAGGKAPSGRHFGDGLDLSIHTRNMKYPLKVDSDDSRKVIQEFTRRVLILAKMRGLNVSVGIANHTQSAQEEYSEKTSGKYRLYQGGYLLHFDIARGLSLSKSRSRLWSADSKIKGVPKVPWLRRLMYSRSKSPSQRKSYLSERKALPSVEAKPKPKPGAQPKPKPKPEAQPKPKPKPSHRQSESSSADSQLGSQLVQTNTSRTQVESVSAHTQGEDRTGLRQPSSFKSRLQRISGQPQDLVTLLRTANRRDLDSIGETQKLNLIKRFISNFISTLKFEIDKNITSVVARPFLGSIYKSIDFYAKHISEADRISEVALLVYYVVEMLSFQIRTNKGKIEFLLDDKEEKFVFKGLSNLFKDNLKLVNKFVDTQTLKWAQFSAKESFYSLNNISSFNGIDEIKFSENCHYYRVKIANKDYLFVNYEIFKDYFSLTVDIGNGMYQVNDFYEINSSVQGRYVYAYGKGDINTELNEQMVRSVITD